MKRITMILATIALTSATVMASPQAVLKDRFQNIGDLKKGTNVQILKELKEIEAEVVAKYGSGYGVGLEESTQPQSANNVVEIADRATAISVRLY